MLYKLKRKVKSESGQSMIEFVLVFPVLMLLIALMLDYGWLFYNQIRMENSARNAARVACVEYSDVCLDPNNGDLPYPDEGSIQEFKFGRRKDMPSDSVYSADLDVVYSEELTETEKKILKEVKNTLPKSLTNVSVFIEYTYDTDFNKSIYDSFKVEDRSKGDVKVTIKATHRAISPLLVAFGTSGNSKMERIVWSNSVYKVERMSTDSGS